MPGLVAAQRPLPWRHHHSLHLLPRDPLDPRHDHGRRERADLITQEAATTGSWGGMQVRGEHLERLGRETEAEGLYQTIAGRYPKSFWKIALVVLLAIIATVIVISLSQQ